MRWSRSMDSGLLVYALAELLIKDSLTPGFWIRRQVVKGTARLLVFEPASGWARNVTYGLPLIRSVAPQHCSGVRRRILISSHRDQVRAY